MTQEPRPTPEQRPYRSDCGVWMESSGNSQSIARVIAVDAMRALGLDYINDFKTRDKIIMAIVIRVDQTLDAAVALQKSLTPEQVERARWLSGRYTVGNRSVSMLDEAVELLREVVGDE